MTSVRIDLPLPVPQGYDVVVGAGALAQLPELLRTAAPAHRYALVSDANVASLWAEGVLERLRAAGLRVDAVTVPAGESAKTRATWGDVLDSFLTLGMGRDGCVLALGGGVVGDLAGFAAATFMRGIPVVQIPTTLLAMVDASIGGKTGIDAPAGKNLIGAFHQPRLVVADPDTLSTLPDRELVSGLAEVIKHGAIADAEYLDAVIAQRADILARAGAALEPVVLRSVQIKAAVVAADPFERGARKALNAGHTLGHALEALSGYTLAHGEAIAIGLVAEARAGERAGVTAAGTAARLTQALKAFGLPTRLPAGLEPVAVLAAARSDKKARAARLHYALLERVGVLARAADGGWSFALDDELVAGALAENGERASADGVF